MSCDPVRPYLRFRLEFSGHHFLVVLVRKVKLAGDMLALVSGLIVSIHLCIDIERHRGDVVPLLVHPGKRGRFKRVHGPAKIIAVCPGFVRHDIPDAERHVLDNTGRHYHRVGIRVVDDRVYHRRHALARSPELELQCLVADQQGHRFHRDRLDSLGEVIDGAGQHRDGFLRITERTLGETPSVLDLLQDVFVLCPQLCQHRTHSAPDRFVAQRQFWSIGVVYPRLEANDTGDDRLRLDLRVLERYATAQDQLAANVQPVPLGVHVVYSALERELRVHVLPDELDSVTQGVNLRSLECRKVANILIRQVDVYDDVLVGIAGVGVRPENRVRHINAVNRRADKFETVGRPDDDRSAS